MLLDSLDWVLPGLLPGSYRGITFHVPDAASEPGRRIVEYLFPGVDAADYDDFGRAPNVISITGLLFGDDYRLQAIALQAAFETAGPATLIHPWLGPMTVIMEQTAQISFSDRELRFVRFSASFKRVDGFAGLSIGGLSGLTSAISAVVSAASLLAGVVGTVLSATRTKSVSRSTRVVASTISSLSAPSGSARSLPRLKAAIATAPPSSPAEFDVLVVSTSALINAASDVPAVSPAAEAVTETAPTALSLMSIGVTIAGTLAASVTHAPDDADRALLSASAHFLAQTAAQSVYADYASSQEAMAFRATATDATDAITEQLETITAPGFLAQANTLRRSVRDLQAALIADINETIGRLPSVLAFQAARPLDAWQLAQHVYGDTPARIESAYLDIVARNRPRHPAALPAGKVEVIG